MAKLCMGCMNPLPEGNTTCAVCGFDITRERNPEYCLPITTALQGHYIVGRFLGAYSDHLLYLGYDRQLREPCFIQEFFPDGLCRRDTIGGVQPAEGCDLAFENYAGWFRTTMRTLARMRDLPAVVPVYDIFEENGTVYAASDYCQGMTLTKKIKLSGGRIPWNEARPLFMPLLSTLAQLNDAGIYHMAVSPDNIVIGADGKARLRNFSIAASHQVGTNLKPALQDGFAAPEQYQMGEAMGAYTDVYGVAATLFRTVTGNELPAGNSRAKNSDDLFMSADVAQELSQPVCAALFNALLVPAESRTATVAVLRDQLSTTPNVAALVTEAEHDMGLGEEEEEDHRLRNMLIVFGSCLVGLLLVLLILYLTIGDILFGKDDEGKDSGATTTTSATGTTVPLGDEEVETPDVIGANYYDLRDSELDGGLRLVLDATRMDKSEPGTILEQDPAPGVPIKEGSEIRVVISSGSESETVVVPDVSGMSQSQAEEWLEGLGFRVKVEFVQSTEYKKGEVVSTDPKARTEKRKGDTITIRVCDTEDVSTTTSTDPTAATSTESSTDPSTDTTATTETTTGPTETTGTTEAGG